MLYSTVLIIGRKGSPRGSLSNELGLAVPDWHVLYYIMASVTFWCKPSGFELSVCGASWATPRSLLNSNTL